MANIHNLQSFRLPGGVMIWGVMMGLRSVVMVTENSVQLGPGAQAAARALTEERSIGANIRPGAPITNTADCTLPQSSISVKPMRCKCINFCGFCGILHP